MVAPLFCFSWEVELGEGKKGGLAARVALKGIKLESRDMASFTSTRLDL